MNTRLVSWAALAFAFNLGFTRLSYGLLLPALRRDFSGAYAVFGLVNTANLIGYFLGTLATPFLLRRIGRPIALNAVALGTMTVALAGSTYAGDLYQLALVRLAIGFVSGISLVLTITITLERTRSDRRGLASGLLWAGFGFGLIVSGLIAPLVVGEHAALSWRQTWLLMALLGPVVTVGFTLAARRTGGVAAGAASAGPAASAVQPSMAYVGTSYFLFGAGYITYFTYVIALVVVRGLPAQFAGLLWSLCGVAGILGGIFAGRALDGRFAFVVLPVVLAIGGLGAFLGTLAPVVAVALGALLMGFSFISTPATVSALLKTATTNADYPRVLSYMTAAFAVGQFVGPVAGGAVVDLTSLRGGIVMAGALMCGAALLALANSLRTASRRRAPA